VTLLQLDPSIPVETEFGYGEAVGWLMPSLEQSLYWIVLLSDSKECRVVPNEEIRAATNWSLWRGRDGMRSMWNGK
jgi:hypothetical protein